MTFFEQKQLSTFDPDLYKAVQQEKERQEQHIELIASENYTTKMVMELQGSQLTNKYAEGYPGKRYYGGCEFVDVVETLAIDRAKKLFGADFANVQPHSGSSANVAVFQTFMKPGDTFLGMSLAEGGHLTHGSPVSFSGSIYNCVSYGLDPKTELIDFNQVEDLAKKHQPKMIIAGFSAYSRKIDWSIFAEIAKKVNAKLLVDMAHVAGLVAAGVYPNPVPHADAVTSTTHKSLRGPRSGIILAKANPEIEKAINSKIFPGNQGGPLMHVVAAKAACFKEAMEPEFKVYQQNVVANAQAMAKALIDRGYDIVSGGTDNHLMLVNLVNSGLTGKAADQRLGEAHITVNKNSVPNDPQSPFVTSGIRLGTPAISTRGFGEHEAASTGNLIADILDNIDDDNVLAEVKSKVAKLCSEFPVYG